MVRADFPHDSYPKSTEIELSDGSLLPIREMVQLIEVEFQSAETGFEILEH